MSRSQHFAVGAGKSRWPAEVDHQKLQEMQYAGDSTANGYGDSGPIPRGTYRLQDVSVDPKQAGYRREALKGYTQHPDPMPGVVLPRASGSYRIVDGHGRHNEAVAAGAKTIRMYVRKPSR